MSRRTLARRALLKAGVAGAGLAVTAALAGCGEEEAAAPDAEGEPAEEPAIEAEAVAETAAETEE